MFTIIRPEIRKLMDEILPWLAGTKAAEDDFAPIFKPGTPDEIKTQYAELQKILKSEK